LSRAELKPTPYDPQKAKDLLAQAGYSNGINNPIELWMLPVLRSYYPDAGKIADAIIADLSKIGVQVVRKEESSWVPFNTNRDSGRYSLYMGGWFGENGDPEEFVTRFFGEERKDFSYNSPFLRDLLKNSRATVQRAPFYSQAQDVIINDMPIIPLAYVDLPVAVRRDVVGYQPSPNGIESWATLSFK
jgi:peptide/nickel transport system substrate-binding protein